MENQYSSEKHDHQSDFKFDKSLGLTTTKALEILYKEIKKVLEEYKSEYHEKKKYKAWLKDALHYKSQHTCFCCTSALSLFIIVLALIYTFFYENNAEFSFLPFEGFIIFIFLLFNLTLTIFDNKYRHHEVPNRLKHLLKQLEEAIKTCNWEKENYPQLCSPLSPCLTLQWTYRDGYIVNLPWALLVSGDVIVLKPGQQIPGYCTPYENPDGPALHAKDIYAPPIQSDGSGFFAMPQARTPLKNKIYKLQETPYISNLRLALNEALNRPITYHNRSRYFLITRCIEQIFFPTLMIVIYFFNLTHYLYLNNYFGTGHWTDMFISRPIAVVLPLLPIAFPFWWIILNCFGMARFKALFKLYQTSNKAQVFDPFEDISDPSHPDVVYNWNELSEYYWNILFGKEYMITRSANILHVLGSVTALCCVDKKGILSWPNPTAEKVFFLRNSNSATNPNTNTVSQASSNVSLNKNSDPTILTDNTPKQDSNRTSYVNEASNTVAEVLDLTHDLNLPFKLLFDDQSWRQHLNSLKPLGLAILLNTCNMETQEHYMQFCNHVTCEALQNENLVPVVNRRCLCELAKQIGFKDQATEIFHLEHQLSTFRHVPETAKRDMKFAKSLSISTKLKFPFPHMVAVVVKEKFGGGSQLLTQGTADIILDSCVDFWDGHDLYPLTESDKKKIQDFYNRNSLTSYCTAFAYRPLHKSINPKMSSIYLELPSESKHLYSQHRSPTPLSWDILDLRTKGVLGQFHSTDSLLCNEGKEDEIYSIEGCFELQCNQIFIGMVTMQYQPQADMVHLIEQLDAACIRFVHFSKENELRSRVFNEKMGLESGWNCHISLLSEKSSSNLDNARTISMSAPSAINMEMSTVKFENENVEWSQEGCKSQTKSSVSHRDRQQERSEDSVLVQSVEFESGQEAWRSLSCLTDSTEQSAPVNFDLSNRAKLPRGIENIKPHIENIDNVPLLVSLFTDCNTTATKEMLHIMQDYGEIVCVLGSSANAENMQIFMQADAAIGVEPLYPQVCQKVPALIPTREDQGVSPIDLSRSLNSITCSLSIKREDPLAIYHLVMEARHFMKCLWNCIQFWLCCIVSLSLMQAISTFFFLPPLFTVGQVLWLICLIIPLLSVSLIGTPNNPIIMQQATGKNQCILNAEVAIFTLWCYGCKFFPTMITVVFWQFISLRLLCPIYSQKNESCFYIYFSNNTETLWGGWSLKPDVITAIQHIALVLTVFHFVIISITFVHRDYSIWRKQPLVNWVWFLISLLVLFVQMAFSGPIIYNFWRDENQINEKFPTQLPFFFVASFPLIFIINEFIKWQEIKVNVRYQKRARLEFGTKLGMNSPF